jgi:hypothetical protein
VHGDDPPATRRSRLNGHKMPLATLVQKTAISGESLRGRSWPAIQRDARLVNRARPSHYDAAYDLTDSLIVASVVIAPKFTSRVKRIAG